MPTSPPDPRVQQLQLPCGCAVVLAVQQAEPCKHNAGQYPRDELNLEQVRCDCEEDYLCDRCNGHGFFYKKRQHA